MLDVAHQVGDAQVRQVTAAHRAESLGAQYAALAAFVVAEAIIFVPMLVVSVASHAGYLELASGFEWVGSYPAMGAFAVATVLEVGAYYIPWLDNLLDTVATPAAVIAGIVVTASAVGDVSPAFILASGILGGTFLMLSYFGTDQSQVQRYLTAKSVDEAKSSLLMSAYWKIPLQALVLMNDPSFVEAARAFAERILTEGESDPEARIRWAFLEALSKIYDAEHLVEEMKKP